MIPRDFGSIKTPYIHPTSVPYNGVVKLFGSAGFKLRTSARGNNAPTSYPIITASPAFADNLYPER